MNDRLQINSAVPADIAERISDIERLDDIADLMWEENERMAKQNAPSYIGQEAFWEELLADTECSYLAGPLANLFANFTEACACTDMTVSRVLGEFVPVEKIAIAQAEKQLFDIYQRDE